MKNNDATIISVVMAICFTIFFALDIWQSNRIEKLEAKIAEQEEMQKFKERLEEQDRAYDRAYNHGFLDALKKTE
jgi:cytochrome oxidase assembly protein ShyY1